MPLRDHFHPPLSLERHWEGLHGAWATAIARELNVRLPERYFAEPTVHWSSRVEVDVATWDQAPGGSDRAAATTATWSPPRPRLRVPAELPRIDVAEVRVHRDEGGPTLVAAIELVSPANKDREAERNAFATKCRAYLLRDVCVVVVDVVTSLAADMHRVLLDSLDRGAAAVGGGSLHAATYRRAPPPDEAVEIWIERLAVGGPLPEIPLWLDRDLAVPVDLEGTYEDTCRGLRIMPA